jgi:hypothetical protein
LTALPNAVAETFFATLTKELLLHDAPDWPTRAGLRSAIFEFVEDDYNRERPCTPRWACARRPSSRTTTTARARPRSRARQKTRKHLFITLRVTNRYNHDYNNPNQLLASSSGKSLVPSGWTGRSACI